MNKVYLSKAESECAKSEQCEFQIREKLKRWGAEDDDIDLIIDSLYANKFLDNSRYCDSFSHDKLMYQGWGRIKIKSALLQKRIPIHFIEESLTRIPTKEYMQKLRSVANTKRKALSKIADENEEKLIRFLLSRGFTYDEIKSCLSESKV